MLLINTAVALTLLPSILSVPASAKSPFRNDFEEDLATDFKASMGKDAPLFAEEEDESVSSQSNGAAEKLMGNQKYFDDENDFSSGLGPNSNQDDMGFSGRWKGPDRNEYSILVLTGDKWLSGTDSGIFLSFGDAKGGAVSTFLSKKNFFDRRLNRNRWGEFKVSTSSKLDDICTITIGNDMRGWFPSWFLDTVLIKKGGDYWTFPVKQWINRKTGDGGRAIITLNNCPSKSGTEYVPESQQDQFGVPLPADSKLESASESSPIFALDSVEDEDLDYGDEEIDYEDINDNIDLPHPNEDDLIASTPCTKSLLPTPVPDVSTPCTKSLLPTPVPVSTPCTKSLLPTPVPDVSTPCTKSLLPTPVPEVSTPCTKSVLPTPESYGPIIPPVFPDEDDYPFVPDNGYGPVHTPVPDYGYGPVHTPVPDYGYGPVHTPVPDNGYGPVYPPFPDSDYPGDVYPTPTIPDIFPEEGYGTPVPLPPRKKCRPKVTPVPLPSPKRKCRSKTTPLPEVGYGTPLPEVGYGTPLPEVGYGTPMPPVALPKSNPFSDDTKEIDDLSFGDIDDDNMDFGNDIVNSKMEEYRFPLQ